MTIDYLLPPKKRGSLQEFVQNVGLQEAFSRILGSGPITITK